MFQFRARWLRIPRYLAVSVVVVFGVGGFDDVTFVGDVHGLAFFLAWKCSEPV